MQTLTLVLETDLSETATLITAKPTIVGFCWDPDMVGYVKEKYGKQRTLSFIQMCIEDVSIFFPRLDAPPLTEEQLDLIARYDSLTPSETRVMEHLSAGLCNKRIARLLGIADGTVKNVLHRVFLKLGVYGRLAVALKYLEATQLKAKTEIKKG